MSGRPVIGSLCSGYGGLDMAAEALTGGKTVWVSDVDKGANKILAHRYPDVPNLGDFTVMDWSTVDPIDVLTAGYPCQPFSHAGKRAGTNDARHLWPEVLRCLTTLRPPFALFENVRGHLSLGFDQVLADLATHDYDARWIVLRAADIGAPHGRARLFILASDARRGGDRWDLVGAGRGAVRVGGVRREDPAGGADAGGADLLGGMTEMRVLPTPRCADGMKANLRPNANDTSRLEDAVAVYLLPTPAVNDMGAAYTPDEWDAWTDRMKAEHGNGNGHGKSLASDGEKGGPNQPGSSGDVMLPAAVQESRWGDYAPAVVRWEQILGRPAPAPTMTSAKGNPQLSPRFVEWMMGLPEGWIDDVPDLTRNEKLKALGNGVVSQQAVEAVLRLLTLGSEVAA